MSAAAVPFGHTWPIELREGPVLLRPLKRREAAAWRRLRLDNLDWLAPWEASNPDGSAAPPTYGAMLRTFSREARAGRMLPFAIDFDGQLIGQLTVATVTWGSLRGASIGYWVSQRFAGRGVTPTAVALATDHCFFTIGLHRVELNIRPENQASLRVATKLGFRPEGIRKRFLHIDGEWRDHASYALTVEDVPNGLLSSWRQLSQDLADARSSASGSDVSRSSGFAT